jgi:hypothetical protein
MKKLIVFIIIIVCGCHSKKDGKIVPYKPTVILGKTCGNRTCYFDFYVNENVYTAPVSERMYHAYEVGDTLHEYQVIPF